MILGPETFNADAGNTRKEGLEVEAEHPISREEFQQKLEEAGSIEDVCDAMRAFSENGMIDSSSGPLSVEDQIRKIEEWRKSNLNEPGADKEYANFHNNISVGMVQSALSRLLEKNMLGRETSQSEQISESEFRDRLDAANEAEDVIAAIEAYSKNGMYESRAGSLSATKSIDAIREWWKNWDPNYTGPKDKSFKNIHTSASHDAVQKTLQRILDKKGIQY